MSDLLNSASLVMIPSGYKEDTVYSVVPSDGSGDLSFTRASNGTRVNSAGLVEVCPWNLQTYSEDFSNVSWAKNNSPVMAYNVATAPNGTMTADSIQSNTASVYQSVSAPTLSVAPNSTVTLSIYIKKETSKTYFGGTFLYFTGGTTKLTYVLFDEVNGTINIVAPDQVSMVTSVESVGDWWRFIVTGTDTGSNTSLDFSFYGTLSQNGTSLSTGIGSVRTIYGAQLNIGSTAKPYFPTTDRLNVPRLTYQNGGGGCPSLLLEKQSTNVVTYSEQIDNAVWTKASASGGTAPVVTANYGISPDGTQNADRIQLARTTTASSYSIVYQTLGATSGQTYTWSVWLKSLSGTPTIGIAYDGAGYNNTVTLTTEWARYDLQVTTTGTSIEANFLLYQVVAATSLTADFLAWGFQIEASSYPTSYIPTTSSSATRVADACFKTGISSLIGQTEGTLFIDAKNLYPSGARTIGLLFTSGSAFYQMYINSSNEVRVDVNGSFLFLGGTIAENTQYKIAFAYKSGSNALYINGTQIATSASTTIPSSLADFYVGNSLSSEQSGSINQAILFPTRLTNSELASITTI